MELNRIYNEDCLEGMKRLNDNSIDLTVTSPPYDNLREYNGFTWNFEGIAKELYRVTKDGGTVVWIVADATINKSETGTSFKQALFFKEIGFNLHDTMIWYKGSCPFPDKTRYYQSFEYMFIFTKGSIKTFNPIKDKKNKWFNTKVHGTLRQADGSLVIQNGVKTKRRIKEFGTRFNMWDMSPERNNKTNHPAVFPGNLVKDHMMTWSNEGDIVLDPFIGSGTTAIVALNTGRNFIGFEIDETYFNLANERIKGNVKEVDLE